MLPGAFKRWFHHAVITDPEYRFVFDRAPDDDIIAIDCETTGLDTRTDEIITIAAIKIRGNRIVTSERFEAVIRPDAKMNVEAIKIHRLRMADVAQGPIAARVMPGFLRYIGGRPLVGYYLDFDMAMLNREVMRFVSIELPNPRIEVSRLYYERKYGDAPPGTAVDLSFASIMADLSLPQLPAHDAFNDALMTAMIFVALRDLKQRGIRIPRPRSRGTYGSLGV